MSWLENRRLTILLQAALAVAVFILANQLAADYFFRWDLTEEKRFSITVATKKKLAELPDNITVEVYLTGDLPAGFKRVQQSLIEILDEFNVYSNGMVTYQIIDPNIASSEKSRAAFIQSISDKGLQPTDVFVNKEGKRTQKRILVGVVVSYGSRELGVQLFKGNKTASAEERLNQSIEGIEFELITAIHQITQDSRPVIGMVTGHDELDSLDILTFSRLLEEHNRVRRVSLNRLLSSQVDLLMIIQPKKPFSTIDKYFLDQYIMAGGKVIFMLDKVGVNMDSAAIGTYSFPIELNLDDLLFKYGVRINNNLVQDFVAGATPIVVGRSGDQAQVQLLQWPFFPILNTFSNHVIVRNLDAIKTEFVSSIDTVKATGIKKTVLLSTSKYSRVSTAPVYVDINLLKASLSPDKFDKQNIAVGYLLEGQFTSYFKNRFIPVSENQDDFRDKSIETGIIVIADGDFVATKRDPRSGRLLPVGYDPFMGQQFANGDLILNAIQYLLEGDGLITARAKQVVIRPLDKVKILANKKFYQFINLLLPLVITLLLGITVFVVRRQKYSKF